MHIKNLLQKNLLPLLFLIFSLNLSRTAVDETRIQANYFLPDLVPALSNTATYFVYIIFSAFGFYIIVKQKKTLPINLLFISGAYLLLFLHSIIHGQEIIRYLALWLIPTFFIPGIRQALTSRSAGNNLSLFPIYLWIFLLLSCLFSILNFSTHPRISGYLSNPNFFSMTVFGTMIIYCASVKKINAHTHLYLIVSMALIIMAGSRLATFPALALLILIYSSLNTTRSLPDKKFSFNATRTVALMLFLTMTYLAMSSMSLIDMDIRAFNVLNSINDSGRSLIWSRAFSAFAESKITGIGGNIVMNLGEHNLHSSYLRILVTSGAPVTALFFTLYLIGILLSILREKSNATVRLYYLTIPVFFFAEDYVVSVSSTFSFFLIFSLLYTWQGFKGHRSVTITNSLTLHR